MDEWWDCNWIDVSFELRFESDCSQRMIEDHDLPVLGIDFACRFFGVKGGGRLCLMWLCHNYLQLFLLGLVCRTMYKEYLKDSVLSGR